MYATYARYLWSQLDPLEMDLNVVGGIVYVLGTEPGLL